MGIAENIESVISSLPPEVKLVAVSKTKPNQDIQSAYDAGQRIFGENKVQELVEKHQTLPQDIEWHYIGHLQTNKVKYIAPFISLIHAVDSLKLLRVIEKEGAKNNRRINVLLQFHVAEEATKYGLSMDEARTILKDPLFSTFQHVSVVGVMGMATYTDDLTQVRREFSTLKTYFEQLKQEFFAESQFFNEISMGMSGDYPLAVEEGSTMVRIGSTIFGERNYSSR